MHNLKSLIVRLLQKPEQRWHQNVLVTQNPIRKGRVNNNPVFAQLQ